MVVTTGRRALAVVVAAGVVLAVTVAVLTAVRDDDAGAPPAVPGSVVERLCQARLLVGAGDLGGADASFEDVHGSLHDLAAEAAEVDRGVAGRLLEAKQAVEADLADPPGADLAQDLERLLTAATAALEVSGASVLPAC